MNKEEFKPIIDEIYSSIYKNLYGNMVNSMKDEQLASDILHDAYLFILEGNIKYPDTTDIHLVTKWFYRVLHFISINKHSKMQVKYFQKFKDDNYFNYFNLSELQHCDITDQIILEEEKIEKNIERIEYFKYVLDTTNQLYWSDKQYLRDYLYKYNSVREFSEATGISRSVIWKRMNYSRKIILAIINNTIPLIVENPVYPHHHSKKIKKALNS